MPSATIAFTPTKQMSAAGMRAAGGGGARGGSGGADRPIGRAAGAGRGAGAADGGDAGTDAAVAGLLPFLSFVGLSFGVLQALPHGTVVSGAPRGILRARAREAVYYGEAERLCATYGRRNVLAELKKMRAEESAARSGGDEGSDSGGGGGGGDYDPPGYGEAADAEAEAAEAKAAAEAAAAAAKVLGATERRELEAQQYVERVVATHDFYFRVLSGAMTCWSDDCTEPGKYLHVNDCGSPVVKCEQHGYDEHCRHISAPRYALDRRALVRLRPGEFVTGGNGGSGVLVRAKFKIVQRPLVLPVAPRGPCGKCGCPVVNHEPARLSKMSFPVVSLEGSYTAHAVLAVTCAHCGLVRSVSDSSAAPGAATVPAGPLGALSSAVLPVLTPKTSAPIAFLTTTLLDARARVAAARSVPVPAEELKRWPLRSRLNPLETIDMTAVRVALEVRDTFQWQVEPALGGDTGTCPACDRSQVRHSHSDVDAKCFSYTKRAGAGLPDLGFRTPNDFVMRNFDRALSELGQHAKNRPGDVEGPSDCGCWKASRDASKDLAGRDVAGLYASACPHGFINRLAPTSCAERPVGHVLLSFCDVAANGAPVSYVSADIACFIVKSLRAQLLRNAGYLDGPVELLWEGCVIEAVRLSKVGDANPHFAVTVRLADEPPVLLAPRAAGAGHAAPVAGEGAAAEAPRAGAARQPAVALGGCEEELKRPFDRLRALGAKARFTYTVRVVLPDWHGKGHSRACNADFGSLVADDAGLRPEWAEHVNRVLSQAAPAARVMGQQQFLVYYRHVVAMHNAGVAAVQPAALVRGVLTAYASLLKARDALNTARGAALAPTAGGLCALIVAYKKRVAAASRDAAKSNMAARKAQLGSDRVSAKNSMIAALTTVLE